MKANRGSQTAEAIAASRAFHLAWDGAPKIFEDPYAIDLTSSRWRRIVRNRLLCFLIVRLALGRLQPARALAVARARYADDRFNAAYGRGVRQCVLIGAGFDSFALRRQDMAEHIRVFEIDHPATQRLKRARVAKLGIDQKNVTYVPVDFETDSMRDKLLSAGFQPDSVAFLSWLGVTYYLSKEAVFGTFRDIAACAGSGSEVVFDYIDADGFRGLPSAAGVRHCMAFAARRGEPWTQGFERVELDSGLDRCGFELAEDVSAAEQEQRYFQGRGDGLMPLYHSHLACARLR
ncbi:MAG: class I SAM-dependent methyltransferase [Gammaproteobacteria bacterium]